MSAPPVILNLIERFDRNREAYQSAQYNETQLRREFLDPFFKALGWDMDNEQGYAEAYKDVIHEDAIRIGGATKAPDYCFRIGGTRKFFLEAKKPSVDIKDAISPAYQLRRYAWSAKLPLSILSDFAELAVYDCRIRPGKDDPAATARIFYCTYQDFPEKWDWIAEKFSREAVLKGSFDKFAESSKAKKGTAEVDASFLGEIETWRSELARNLAIRNPSLKQRELNFAVQRIIDRIIFLRICEDRGLEDYGRLRALVNGDRIYPRLVQLFEAADTRYNSGLFHFKPEPGRHEPPDELTLSLHIDDKLLREILRNLYYPESPYEFSVLSADILGQVYEQFLGKVIRLTEGHRAVVEDKPEVKKAGGVYYTPIYIVQYIVQQTVGKLVEGKTPRQAASLRILDPACGSGSFLIGAYQYLLDWHRDWYTNNDPVKWAKGRKPALHQTSGGGWKLTIDERKRILLNNIYGVDIDPQAVEVTKLALLLKVLEGETTQSLQPLFQIFHERALPDLGDNIKCGNSLIGPDFYQQSELPLLTDEERYRINVFDWHAEFPQIFRRKDSPSELRETASASPLDYTVPGIPLHGSYPQKKKKAALCPLPMEDEWEGGFDAVIGNPPYVRPHNLMSQDKKYFWANYNTFTHKSDLYCCFMEKGMSLLRIGGLFSFIVSHGWLRLNSFQALRKFILKNAKVRTLVELPFRVFEKAVVDTGIFSFERGKARSQHKIAVVEGVYERGAVHFRKKKELPQIAFLETFQNVFDLSISPDTELIKERMREGLRLGDCFDVLFGLKTGDDKKYLHFSKGLHKEDKALLRGDDIKRYAIHFKGEYVWYVPEKMRLNKDTARPGTPDRFERPKVLVKDTSRDFGCSFDPNGFYVKDVLIVLPKPGTHECCDLRFLTGLLNSKLMYFYYRTTFPTLHVQNEELGSLPLPKLSQSKEVDRSRHDRIVKLVDQMLSLHREQALARTPQEQTALARQIDATDTQIDRLVYELYGLTEEEIKIVEGAAK